jgi:hypothetical protein
MGEVLTMFGATAEGRGAADGGWERQVGRAQAIFYVATGIWPIVHLRSFEAVTGPKADRWLVRTLGALITVIGAALLRGTRGGRVSPELRLLAVGSALSLAAIDVIYVARGRIRRVYLLDALAELALALLWGVASRAARRS